jgi:methylmalonyl-CoA mutase C-terminal domain/subunit
MEGKRIRVLVAKPGLDGHDVGAKVVTRALRDAGFEVIYSGLRKTPEEIATLAEQEDVDVVGLSVLSGSHVPLCQKVARLLEGNDSRDRLLIVGGSIPERDRERLKELGADAVFPAGSPLESIVSFIRENAG